MLYKITVFALTLVAGALLSLQTTQAQDGPKKKDLKEFFQTYSRNEKIKFFYKEEWIRDVKLDENYTGMPLQEFLRVVASQTGLSYTLYSGKYVIFLRAKEGTDTLSIQKKIVDESNFRPDGRPHTISGYINDANSGEAIIGASIFVDELKTGTTTNAFGFFSLTLPSRIYNLTISAAGKAPRNEKIFLNDNQSLAVELFEKVVQLNDVVITAESINHNVISPNMSLLKLSAKTIKSLPSFMGEVDIIKSIRLLPGVSSVGDGAGGFNVRGGNVDQNLILMDDAPIYNSSHLFGFFSTFNPDVVKEVSLHKGGIPPQYGGRLSSVLDVKLSEGNNKNFKVSGGVGLITSRLTVEGPIIKDRTSFIIGGRYAYPDWILPLTKDLNLKKSRGYFYDLNAKVSHKFNDKNNLHLSAYTSEDGFKFAGDTTYRWNMLTASAKWNTVIMDKLFLSVTGLLSEYNYSVEGTKPANEYTADFGITNYGGKADLSYSVSPDHRIDAGLSYNDYKFSPGNLKPGEGSTINPLALQNEFSREYGIYIGDESKLNSRISVSGGVRFSFYTNIGKSDVLVYSEEVPKDPSTVIDTLSFSSGEAVKKYQGIEPRVSMKVSINETSSVKLSYNKTIQYIHLISNTTAISPLDLWKSSNYYIKPQSANQFAIGYFKNFNEKGFETSIEVYYKDIANMVEYKDGANLFLNPYLESSLLSASGKAYGAELLVKKNLGKLTGWIGYTYARTWRKVKGDTPGETINKGNYYPSNFDKPNDLSVVVNYKITRRFTFASNFTYSTGRPITYPASIYIVDGYVVSQYSERNQGRTPDYHRLDISLTVEDGFRKSRKWKGSWTFSVFNLYGRKNPYSVFFRPEYNGKQAQAYRLSVLGTIFPSVTYNFKF